MQGPGVATGRSGSIGKVHFIPGDYWPLNTALYVKDFHGNEPRFVFRLLQHLDLSTYASGAGVPTLNRNNVHPAIVVVPESIREQERIVAILDEAFEAIDTAIANTEKNLANARELFESYLNAAILGELNTQDDEHGEASVAKLLEQLQRLRKVAVEQGRAKPAKVGPIDIELQTQYALPPNWEWVQLERLTVGISDGVHKKPDYTREGIPFIKVNNLTAGPGISFEDVSYISRVDHEEFIRRTHPEMGDILITKDGTIGVVRMIETDIEFSIFVSVALIKPVMRKLGPYLVYALRAPSVQSQIVPKGAALKHLYLTDLRRLAIPFPPLAVQLLIVSRIDAFAEVTQRLESLCQKKLTALKELKQSILQKAFSGELTASADSVLREASL